MDCSPPGSSFHGVLQARILGWVAIPFSRGSSWPRDQTWVSCIAGRLFTVWATREAQRYAKEDKSTLRSSSRVCVYFCKSEFLTPPWWKREYNQPETRKVATLPSWGAQGWSPELSYGSLSSGMAMVRCGPEKSVVLNCAQAPLLSPRPFAQGSTEPAVAGKRLMDTYRCYFVHLVMKSLLCTDALWWASTQNTKKLHSLLPSKRPKHILLQMFSLLIFQFWSS